MDVYCPDGNETKRLARRIVALLVVVRQSLFPMRAMQALQPPIGLRMGDSGLDVSVASRCEKTMPLSADELAAMIMHDPRLARQATAQPVEGLPHRRCHSLSSHGQIQTSRHQVAAVAVQNVHQVVPAGPNEQVLRSVCQTWSG